MTPDRARIDPASATAAGVRLCDHCGRLLPALDKNEYTPDRARAVLETGYCVCPDGAVAIPDHGPSLL
jgi:hypothetical protein